QLTGDPWDAYIHKNLFTPLGLTTSSFRTTPWWLASVRSANYTVVKDSVTGQPRTVTNPTEFDPGITTPNGGWNAPLDDLARYVAFLMDAPADRPRVRDAFLLSRATLEEMWTPVVPMRDGYEADSTQSVGLGFFVRGAGRARVIGHTGSQAGFRSFFYVNPATKTGIVAVFNTTNAADPARALFDQLHRQAIALVQGTAAGTP
ncbi:MAG: serine hydrolase domain-containing protein, partial [Gemmatimonadota bacterium]